MRVPLAVLSGETWDESEWLKSLLALGQSFEFLSAAAGGCCKPEGGLGGG